MDVDELPYLLVRAAAVTQTPGAIVSAYGQDTQFILPANLNCAVTGSIDEANRQVRLAVHADKPVDVVAWWPKAWGAAKVVVAGNETAGTPIRFDTEDFVRFSLEKGDRDVIVTSR